ncbi:MAG: ABC transporter substrate-binding protein [Azospirillaceae bacterium]
MMATTRIRAAAAATALATAAATALWAGGATAQDGDELTPVSFRLDWRAGAQHAPFYLGASEGFYAEEGIDLEIISGSGSSDAVKQLGSGAIEMALVDALVMVQAVSQEVPVQAVGAYYQRSPIVVMSPEEDPVTSVDQLLGDVKLGSKKGSATYQGLIALLGANDLALEDVTLVDIGFGVQPLLVGQVDAMMGFAMNEPIEASTAGMPVTVMSIADAGVDTYGLTLASNADFMAEHGDVVEGFVAATKRAIEATKADHAAAVAALDAAVAEIDTEREMAVLEATLPYWESADTAEAGVLAQTGAHWQQTAEIAAALGLVDAAPPADALYTGAFLTASE